MFLIQPPTVSYYLYNDQSNGKQSEQVMKQLFAAENVCGYFTQPSLDWPILDRYMVSFRVSTIGYEMPLILWKTPKLTHFDLNIIAFTMHN